MPIGYSLGVLSLVCGGGIAAAIVASAMYILSKRYRLAKAALAAISTLLLVFVVVPELLSFLADAKRGALNKPELGDLVGTWKAVYQNVGFKHASGFEILILRADGTYQQTYQDGKGYVYTSPWYEWWLDEGSIVHLDRGRFYLHGTVEAEMIAEGDAVVAYPEVTLDGTEIILYVWRDANAPGGLVLEHLPVGDGDSPEIVQFYQESTLIPPATDSP